MAENCRRESAVASVEIAAGGVDTFCQQIWSCANFHCLETAFVCVVSSTVPLSPSLELRQHLRQYELHQYLRQYRGLALTIRATPVWCALARGTGANIGGVHTGANTGGVQEGEREEPRLTLHIRKPSRGSEKFAQDQICQQNVSTPPAAISMLAAALSRQRFAAKQVLAFHQVQEYESLDLPLSAAFQSLRNNA